MKSFVERSTQEWADMLGANLHGVRACFQVAARHMMDRAKQGDPFGRLIATSSVAALEGAAFNEHYGTSKGAVNALVRALAVELARHGITVNAILPGYAESDMTRGLMSNEKFVGNVIPRICFANSASRILVVLCVKEDSKHHRASHAGGGATLLPRDGRARLWLRQFPGGEKHQTGSWLRAPCLSLRGHGGQPGDLRRLRFLDPVAQWHAQSQRGCGIPPTCRHS